MDSYIPWAEGLLNPFSERNDTGRSAKKIKGELFNRKIIMKRIPVMSMVFSGLLLFVGAAQAFGATTLTTTVELPAVIHFLTPAGDNIEVWPGIYEMETAESCLKLIPDGQRRTEGMLVDPTSGTHEELLRKVTVRLEQIQKTQMFFIWPCCKQMAPNIYGNRVSWKK